MCQRIGIYLLVIIGLTVNAQTINLRGKITSQTGKPISQAIITLASKHLKDTTGIDGTYSITKRIVAVSPTFSSLTEKISVNKGILEIILTNSSLVKIDMYDLKGKLLNKVEKFAMPGAYQLNIGAYTCASNMLMIHASMGKHEMTFQYNPLINSSVIYGYEEKRYSNNHKLSKITDDIDSIVVTANGYKTKTVKISTYETELNITFDTAGSGSAGCGKPLSTLKSGTYKITSAGLSREYIISIPDNYNPNQPYRLIFCWHWMGGNMTDVQTGRTVPGNGAWAFYGLKRLDTEKSAIFVAPQGIGNGWGQGEKDLTFFDDMLKLFKGELCIDTTRVFSTGFSYGAMFTYSLACSRAKYLRAVACQAAANYNIYIPANSGKDPIAYMGSVGLSDGTCPPSAGRACRDKFVANNGCIKPATVPETTVGSKKHVVYDYQGGKYPVKWCTFDGGHIAAPHDGATNDDGATTWVPAETWKFFTQF